MRLVVVVLEPSHVEAMRQALAGVHVTRLTICDAQGYDDASGRLAQQAVMEIAVNDDFLDRTVDTIAAAIRLRGGRVEDRLQVLPIEEAVQIYREVRGPEAV
jgi:nitrogen regulatory protein P-II 1